MCTRSSHIRYLNYPHLKYDSFHYFNLCDFHYRVITSIVVISTKKKPGARPMLAVQFCASEVLLQD